MKEMKVIGRVHQPQRMEHIQEAINKKQTKYIEYSVIFIVIGIFLIFGKLYLIAIFAFWVAFLFFLKSKQRHTQSGSSDDWMSDDMYSDPAYCNVPGNIFYYSCHND